MFTNIVLLCSYGVIAGTALHVILGNWSGIASLGNFAAALFSIPFLLIRAWMLRRDLRGEGLIQARWIAIAAFPLVFVAFWGISIAVGEHAGRNASPIMRYEWPLDKYGRRYITLNVPGAFGGMDAGAQAMNKAVYGENYGKTESPEEPVIAQMLLTAKWPELAPDSAVIHHAVESKDPSLVLALIESGARAEFNGKNYDRLQIAFDIAFDDSSKHICVLPYEWSTQPHPTQPECLERQAPDVKTPEFGLNRIGVDFSKYPNIPNDARKGLHADDLYYLRGEDGRLLTFIQCAAIERAPDNRLDVDAARYGCKHQFISSRTDSFVALIYPRAYLKDWRLMEKRWNDLIDSFVNSSSSDDRLSHK